MVTCHPFSIRTGLALLLGACLLALPGCHGLGLTQATSSGSWAWLARGSVPPERETAWNAWAAEHVQSGDIVFVLGDSRVLLGLVNFSKLSTEIAESPFSHVGLASREGDEVFVYDIVAEGARHISFGKYMNDGRVLSVAIKRLRPEYQGYVPGAIAYCRKVCAAKCRFDLDFRLDNERLYCSEMLELAFRSGGLALSEAIPINQLPRFDLLREPTKHLVTIATRVEYSQPIYLPGNERFGIWACPYLELVLPPVDAASPPREDAPLRESAIAGSFGPAGPARRPSADHRFPGPAGIQPVAYPSAAWAGR